MKIKSICAASCLLLVAVNCGQAATVFVGPGNDFSTGANWNNGLPGAGNSGTIDGGLTAEVNGNQSIGTARLDVGANGSAGTLNINSGTLSTANGTPGMRVGVGAGSVGTINVNNGGTLSILGAGADLFIGDAAGGTGSVTIFGGGTLDSRKAVEVINGRLFFEHDASYANNQPQDELVIDNNGVLGFGTDGASVTTITSTLNALELGATSTLHMELGGSFSVGDTWTLISGITSFTGVNGGSGTGVFGSVVNPNNANHEFTVHYGTGPAAAGELVVELTAVPEPSSMMLVGLGGLILFNRRRKS